MQKRKNAVKCRHLVPWRSDQNLCIPLFFSRKRIQIYLGVNQKLNIFNNSLFSEICLIRKSNCNLPFWFIIISTSKTIQKRENGTWQINRVKKRLAYRLRHNHFHKISRVATIGQNICILQRRSISDYGNMPWLHKYVLKKPMQVLMNVHEIDAE